MIPAFQDSIAQNSAMKKYYRFQSKIYDMTRWTFLFGRANLVHELPIAQEASIRVLEVGCGTGYNLQQFGSYFRNATLTGIDVSEDMIQHAQKKTQEFQDRVQLLQGCYTSNTFLNEAPFDVVVFSYALTMINPQWKELIELAYRDIRPGGIIAVVDFHDSKNQLFKAHMKNNHVRMDGHLLPVLATQFSTLSADIQMAYLGVWRYFSFVGIKPYYSLPL